MKRHSTILILTIVVTIFGPSCTAAEPVTPAASDALAPLPSGSVRLTGPMGDAIQTCIQGRIRGQSIPDLIRPFAERPETELWQTEFWGKWFTSAAAAYCYQPEPELRAIIDRAAKDLMATQTPDGYIGTYKKASELSNWDVWGRKYVLLGLLAYHDATGNAQAIDAARREADYTIGQIGPGKADIVKLGWWTGMAASSILEPTVLLYRNTGEKRYLEFAQYIVNQWKEPGGPDLLGKALNGVTVFKMFSGPDKSLEGYAAGGQSKAYEMMSCYEGLLELYRITGQPEYLEAVKKVFHDIDATEITILGSGSSWERWCSGHTRQTEPLPEWMETCVTVTWIKLAAQLLRQTGDPLYADRIEQSVYNALLGAQKTDGTWWSHYNPMKGPRSAAPEHCNMHQNCCVANGPRGLMLLPTLAVMKGSAGPVVEFYESGTAKVPSASGKTVQLEVKGDYPRRPDVDILVQPESPEAFTLSLRIPAWSRKTKVEVNGQEVPGITPGSYAKLERTWAPGDRVHVTFDMAVRVVKDPGGSGQVAVVRGPVVLALDKRITQPAPGVAATIKADPQGIVEAIEVRDGVPDGIRSVFDIPCTTSDGKTILVRMCDYASAGRTWSDESALRVWLPQPLNLDSPFAP